MSDNLPLSEQFRIVAKQWVDQDNAARLLEETKTTVLSEMKAALIGKEGDMPDAHAEREVKASPAWRQHIETMVKARGDANRLKMQLEYIRMRHSEQQSYEATARAESRL